MTSQWGQPCVAITAKGRMCGHGHKTEIPCIWEWDPTTGRGIGGPSIPLCRMHDYLFALEEADRIEILGGWMGRGWNPDAECTTVSTTVYASKVGYQGSLEWWRLRQPIGMGTHCPTYHAARARAYAGIQVRAAPTPSWRPATLLPQGHDCLDRARELAEDAKVSEIAMWTLGMDDFWRWKRPEDLAIAVGGSP